MRGRVGQGVRFASRDVAEKEKAVRQFIISRSTAISLLRTRQRLQEERLNNPGQPLQTTPTIATAPVDFHKRQMDFTFDPTTPLPRPSWSGHALSMNVLLQALKENLSYEVFISRHFDQEKLSYSVLRVPAPDGSVFSLSEPSPRVDEDLEAREAKEGDEMEVDAGGDEHEAPAEGTTTTTTTTSSSESRSAFLAEEALKRHIREGKVLDQYGKDSECIGSMLYMSNLKMHRTSGYSTTTDFSKEFARAAGVKEGHVTLDLFLGLGYASQEALALGSERVFAFEKYPAVQSLVRRNPWSMDIDDPSLAHRFKLQTLDVQLDRSRPLFRFFESYQQKGLMPSLFNSVILDPPKKKVMLYIYSKYFLDNLAEWVKRDGVVAAYMPPGGVSPKYTQCREELVQTFEDTRKFEFLDCWDKEQMIWRFRRR